MNQIGFIALGGLFCCLGGVVAAEAINAGNAVLIQPAQTRMAMPVAMRPSTDHAGQLVSAVLARPLFNHRRRPPAIAPKEAGGSGLPRLSGIMVSSQERLAIFAPAAGKPVVAGEGSRIGRFTVRAISAGAVVVLGPDGAEVLHPSFGAGGPPGAAAAPPAVKPPVIGFAGLAVSPGTVLPGGITIEKPVPPSAAGWSGPPGLTSLPVRRLPAASAPLLRATRSPG